MKALELINVLRDIAPEHLAEKWDKVGLHAGRYDQNIRRTLLCIDLTEAVLDEAIRKKCQMIVAYHPPIFRPVERLVADTRDWKQTLLVRLIEAGIAVYSPHTALDAVRGGITDWFCDGLGKEESRYAISEHVASTQLHKIVVFVPANAAERVRNALADAGAGGIGEYSHCSFNSQGIGTFRPLAGANPTIGKVGELESVEEIRVEMVCHEYDLGRAIHAMKHAHPYEEPAFDVFAHAPQPDHPEYEHGAGRVQVLKTPITPLTLIKRVKTHLKLGEVKAAIPSNVEGPKDHPGKLQQIAVCVGAGGSLFEKEPGCDAYITGEMQHHQVLDLQQRGAVVILAGHTNTERPFLPTYRDMIRDRLPARQSLQVEVSDADKAPMARA